MNFSYSSPSTDSNSRLFYWATMLSTKELNRNSPIDSSRRLMITDVIAVPTSKHVTHIVGKGLGRYLFSLNINTCSNAIIIRFNEPINLSKLSSTLSSAKSLRIWVIFSGSDASESLDSTPFSAIGKDNKIKLNLKNKYSFKFNVF